MFYQIFLSPQVKRWAIITYNYGINELPHELPNDLRLVLFISPLPKQTCIAMQCNDFCLFYRKILVKNGFTNTINTKKLCLCYKFINKSVMI